MGARRPKHVEKVCSNKICILLYHVGVLFNLYNLIYFFNERHWKTNLNEEYQRLTSRFGPSVIADGLERLFN